MGETGQITNVLSLSSGIAQKLSLRVRVLRQLVSLGWHDGAKILRKAAMSLVYSTAEYFAPFWCRSAYIRLLHSA